MRQSGHQAPSARYQAGRECKTPLLFDPKSSSSTERVLPQKPLLNSERSGWKGIYVQQHHISSHETPEHCLENPGIVVPITRKAVEVERSLVGEVAHERWTSGQIAVIPANVPHICRSLETVNFLTIFLDAQFLERMKQECSIPAQTYLIPHFATRQDPLIFQLALTLKSEIEAGYPGGSLYGDSIRHLLEVHLLKNYVSTAPQFQTYTDGLNRDRLQTAIDYIQAHLDRKLTLAAIACHLNVSVYYFCELFKQSTGVAPYKYVLQQRVERAKQLLKDRNRAIAEIALECGFANQTHLNRHFHRMTGMTPKTYRIGQQ